MSPLTSMLAVSVCCFSIVKTTKDSIHSLIICLQMTFDLGNFVSRFSIINQVSSLGFNTQTRHPPEPNTHHLASLFRLCWSCSSPSRTPYLFDVWGCYGDDPRRRVLIGGWGGGRWSFSLVGSPGAGCADRQTRAVQVLWRPWADLDLGNDSQGASGLKRGEGSKVQTGSNN